MGNWANAFWYLLYMVSRQAGRLGWLPYGGSHYCIWLDATGYMYLLYSRVLYATLPGLG